MKISIRDPDKHAIWALPDAGLHLADEANDPIEVDYKKLTTQQMMSIYLGIRNKVLLAEEIGDFVEVLQQRLKPSKPEPPVVDAIDSLPPIPDQKMEEQKPQKGIVQKPDDRKPLELISRAEELKKLLNYKVKQIIPLLAQLRYSDVKILLDLEKNGKRRKTLIKEIEVVMKNVEEQVQQSISQIDPHAPTAEKLQEKLVSPNVPSNLLKKVQPVVESDEEEILIKFGED